MSDGGEPLYLLAGGEPALRGVVEDFYDRVFADTMIGFFFRNADKRRLVEKELELALELLGADVAYSGRDLRAAHRRHPIMGGQFSRRLQILRETLDDHAVPDPVREAWIAETLRLRPQVTADAPDECRPREALG